MTQELLTPYPGKFFLGINFNGSPYHNSTAKAIVVYSQDSALTPYKGADFPGAASFYGLYAQCRCAAVKIKYILIIKMTGHL